MSKLFFETISKEQKDLFERLPKVCSKGVLGGGTAIALQLGHRQSVDLDIFLNKPVPKTLITRVTETLSDNYKIALKLDNSNELTLFANSVKITFLFYPFPPKYEKIKTTGLPLFDRKDLSANKAYTVGRRGSYKDYVDLYFLLRQSDITLKQIIRDCQQRFEGAFSEKLFLEQLTYFGDISDFSIKFSKGKKVSPEEVKQFLARESEHYLK